MKGTIIFIYANYSVGYLGDTRMSNSFIHLFKTLIGTTTNKAVIWVQGIQGWISPFKPSSNFKSSSVDSWAELYGGHLLHVTCAAKQQLFKLHLLLMNLNISFKINLKL